MASNINLRFKRLKVYLYLAALVPLIVDRLIREKSIRTNTNHVHRKRLKLYRAIPCLRYQTDQISSQRPCSVGCSQSTPTHPLSHYKYDLQTRHIPGQEPVGRCKPCANSISKHLCAETHREHSLAEGNMIETLPSLRKPTLATILTIR